MKILDVRKIEPENPDGMYYENRKAISQIMGAREVAEVCAYVQTDEQIQELHFSLARYKKYWKMILCNDLEKWHDPKPAILLVEEKSVLTPQELLDGRWKSFCLQIIIS